VRPEYEVADILSQYGDLFRESKNLTSHQLRTLDALTKCRTAALGGHIDTCDTCGHIRVSYNSCRNRHCPKCQTINRERWIVERESDLLPVTYFHVVFTIPEEINALCLKHPADIYNILFQASWETLQRFGHDPKHLGAETGMVSVLHTWGQNLSLHPHTHCIIPGGGITTRGKWKVARSKGKYLFPVKAMSIVYRAKFTSRLRQWAKERGKALEQQFFDQLFTKNWVVDARQPFPGPQQVIEYLGRYTHRIAISNHRIKSIKDDKVLFRYKDYRHGGKIKIMELGAIEFLRRFSLHILPPAFVKMRHYGILSNRNKKERLQQARESLNTEKPKKEKLNWKEISRERLNYDPDVCPCCKKGKMQITGILNPGRGPPDVQHLLKQMHMKLEMTVA
jgi:hypothetical protein